MIEMSVARRTVMEKVPHVLVILVFVAAIATAQSGIPIFTKEPSDQTLSEDSTVTLECEASVDSGALDYSWSFNGVPFQSSDERTYTQDGTLTFQLTRVNVGKFACLASTSRGTVSSRPANVQIAGIVAFLPNERVVTVTQDSPLTLRCDNYTSVGRTIVEWSMYDGLRGRFVSIQDTDALIVGEQDFGLYFPAVRKEQEGLFVCEVSTEGVQRYERGSFQLMVNAGSPAPAPPILSQPQDMTVALGQRAVFQCIPSGSPVPTVEWSSGSPGQRFMRIGSYSIVVLNVSLSDSGIYSCRVNGTVYSASLTVIDAARVALEGGPTHTVPYGETLTVQCSVTNGREDVTWSWFSDGEKLVTDARGDVAAGSLSLRDTVLADAGFYQCFATNLAGSSVAVATVAVVTIPPEFSPGGRLQDQVAFRGDSLNLTCSARSAPPSTYTWTKDSLPVVSSPALDLSNGQLVIKNVSSEFVGNYTCLAKATLPENRTVIGEVSSSGEVRVVEPTAFTSTAEPLVYRQVKDNPRPIVLPCAVEGDGVAVIDITWQRNGAPLSPGSSGPSLSSPSPRALTLTFETWSPSDSGVYECRVSTSLMGFSTSVPRVTSSTTNLTIAIAPAPPTSIRGQLFEDLATQIEISWDYLGDSDFVVSFTVYRQIAGTTSWIFVATITDVSQTRQMDTGVHPFTEYRFRVDVTDRKGQEESAYSEYYMTPEAAPTAVPISVSSALVNKTMLRISWQPPPERNIDRTGRNGIITEYEVQHRVPLSGDDFSITTVDGSATQVLLLGTELEVKIAASTSKGQGPFTVARVFDGSDLLLPTATPFYKEVWFLAVVAVAGLIVLISVVVIVCICCVACCKWRRSRTYQVPFRGGDQPNFDVYQYEMEKGTRLRSIQPVGMYHDGQVAAEDPYHVTTASYMGRTENDYPTFAPLPALYAMRGRVASVEWDTPPPPPPLPTLGPQRAKSFEWDPRQQQPTPNFFAEWSQPESMRGVVDNRLNTLRTEWAEGPDEVFSGQQVEVVHIGAQGSDSPNSSMEKATRSASDDGEDDTASQALSFAASSTFV